MRAADYGALRAVWGKLEAFIELSLAIVVFVVMLVTVVDVCGRYFFSAPVKASFEMNQIGMALIIYLGLPLVTARNEHIVAGALHERLPKRLERLRLVFINVFCATVAAVLAWRLLVLAGDFTSRGNVTWFLRIPLAPLAYFVAGACIFAALLFLVKAWKYVFSKASLAEERQMPANMG